MRRKKGQSILEYVIVLTAIIAAIAYAATQFIGPAVSGGFEDAQDAIEDATDRMVPAP